MKALGHGCKAFKTPSPRYLFAASFEALPFLLSPLEDPQLVASPQPRPLEARPHPVAYPGHSKRREAATLLEEADPVARHHRSKLREEVKLLEEARLLEQAKLLE